MVHRNLMFKDTIPNASSHFGVGDVIAWTGINRAGSATVTGQAIAQNIYSAILNFELSPSAEPYAFTELPHWDAVIGQAVDKQCLVYDPKSGIKNVVEVMKDYFGDDLGWSASLKYMDLTDVVKKGEETEVAKMVEVCVQPASATA